MEKIIVKKEQVLTMPQTSNHAKFYMKNLRSKCDAIIKVHH